MLDPTRRSGRAGPGADGAADVAVELSGRIRRCTRRSGQSSHGRVVAAGFYQGPAIGLDLGEEFHHNRVSIVASQIGVYRPR